MFVINSTPEKNKSGLEIEWGKTLHNFELAIMSSMIDFYRTPICFVFFHKKQSEKKFRIYLIWCRFQVNFDAFKPFAFDFIMTDGFVGVHIGAGKRFFGFIYDLGYSEHFLRIILFDIFHSIIFTQDITQKPERVFICRYVRKHVKLQRTFCAKVDLQ